MNVRYEFPMRPILTCLTLNRRLLDVGPMELGATMVSSAWAVWIIARNNSFGAARAKPSHEAVIREPERQVKDGQG